MDNLPSKEKTPATTNGSTVNEVVEHTPEPMDEPVKSQEEIESDYLELKRKYDEEIQAIKEYGKELMQVFHKSQDTFEQQLPYIAAGALGLSVGFMKDIITPIKEADSKWLLIWGWALLIATLLINLVSHVIAGKFARKGGKEIQDIDNNYDPKKIEIRTRYLGIMNWTTIATLTIGIILIVLFVILNGLYQTDAEKAKSNNLNKTTANNKPTDTGSLKPASLPKTVLLNVDTTKK